LTVSEQDSGQADEQSGPPAGSDPARKAARNAAKAAVPDTIGGVLRQAREAAGLSLHDVAHRTKVRPGLLTLIEADEHDALPALTYSIGFVRAYARTVGLDPVACGERYREESRKGAPVPTMVDMQPLDARRMPSKRLVAGVGAALVLVLGTFWGWGAGWFSAPPPPVPLIAEAGEPPLMDEDFSEATAAVPGAADSAAPVPGAPVPGAPVSLRAKTEVWLRVSDRDSGETFFMGTMAPAQVLTLPPGKPWVLRTGRAGALDVKVGERAIPPLGGDAETVRALSLAPADLLALPVPSAGGLAPMQPIANAASSPGAPVPARAAPQQ